MTGSALAVARILAGGAFLYIGVTKLLDDEFLYGGLMLHISDSGSAFGFYQNLVLKSLEFHQTLVAQTVAYAEIVVGVSLLVGLFVSWGALLGAFLVANYTLATAANDLPRLLLNAAILIVLVALGRMGAGLTWGLDGWLIRHLKDWLVLFPLRRTAPETK